jgi:cyclopropane-fatty-acyl-phospholipid synthase
MNVAHHYDLSSDLYGRFLDRDRFYSCAYFDGPDDDIETAQARKARHLAAKLALAPGHRVLDIGCGWGSLGIHLSRLTGATVEGVTLSKEQHAYARDWARRMGLETTCDFQLKDYRETSGPFDRIVSVGMFEHVGVNHYGEYFAKISDLLTDDGVAVVHSIGRSDGPGATNPWIAKYIFPGGYTPALSEVLPSIERAGLMVTDVEILRLHYAETLRHWRKRFMDHWDEVADIYDARFCRMWEFYLVGAELGFRHQGLMVFQIQMAKSLDALPLTRDYMVDTERALPLATQTQTLGEAAE